MAMELLDGEELEHVFARIAALSPEAVMRIAAQTLSGLERAHEVGVIHRDIKPQNIFLARAGEGVRAVKIVDFGIAKLRPSGELSPDSKGLTQTGAMMGSPLYMSPEQAKGERTLDARTDIWSLGIVMYRALTGKVPREEVDTLGKLIIEICAGPPEPVQTLAPWVPPEICDIVERALEVDRDLRYPSAGAMLEDIDQVLGGDRELREEHLSTVNAGDRRKVAPPSRASAMGRRRAISHADTIADLPIKNDTYQGVAGQTTDPGRAAPRRRVELYVAAAAVLLVGAVVVSALVDRSPPPVSPADPPTPAPTHEPAPTVSDAPAPPALTRVKLRLQVQPDDAEVFRGDQRLGIARDVLELPRGEGVVTLTLKKRGYRSKDIAVTPREDVALQATLEPLGRAAHPDLESPL
jgi:serine/threonine-protein kinase